MAETTQMEANSPPQRPFRALSGMPTQQAPYFGRICFRVAIWGEAAPKVALPECSRPQYGALWEAAPRGL
eukprot:15475008-Alexandrium_andersonii.AAC.1